MLAILPMNNAVNEKEVYLSKVVFSSSLQMNAACTLLWRNFPKDNFKGEQKDGGRRGLPLPRQCPCTGTKSAAVTGALGRG